jgi:Tfp pilus assembly protein PilE
MQVWSILGPIVGVCLAIAQPLARYAEKQRHEAAVISSMQQLQQAQHRFTAAAGGYATDVATLAAGCPGASPVPPAVFKALYDAGYGLELRPSSDSAAAGLDCHGRVMATNYYVAAAPQTTRETADKAFAGRADGQLFFFVDGVPPGESDMTSGLAIPIDALKSFRIP